jgi:hypothetical protein
MGHSGTDKCMYQISETFYVKYLGRKVREYVAQCDICQRVKHSNRAFDIEIKSHVPTNPGYLLTVDLYNFRTKIYISREHFLTPWWTSILKQ